MAIRFRKSIKLAPGVRLSVGKKSGSVRVGGKLGGVSLGTKSRTVSASLPGTGLGISSQKRGGCAGTAAVLLAISLALPVAVIWPRPANAQPFEVWEEYEPPPITCNDGWIGLTLNDSGCLQVSGNAKELIGSDTAAGNYLGYSASGRAAVIVDDAVGLAGVVGTRMWRSPYWSYNSSGVLMPDTDHFELSEGFVTFGRGLTVRAGLLDATFDSLAASAQDFDWLTDIDPADSHYGQSSIPRGGLGAQMLTDHAGPFAAAVGLEDIGSLPASGTALGYLHFSGASETESKLTGMISGVADGRVDDWSMEAFARTKLGAVELLSTATASSAEAWQALLSSRLTLGQVFVAASVERGSRDETEVIGSIHVGDPELGPSLGIGGRLYHSEASSIGQVEVRGSVLPLENMQLTASLGNAEITNLGFYRGPIQYGSVGATWRPTDMVQLTAQYTANSLGGWKVGASAEQRF